MDVVFDIDGTLANAEHRLHFIKDPNFWITPRGTSLVPRKPDWESFLADEHVANDTPIPQTWKLMTLLLQETDTRILFITGRPESSRPMTETWLTTPCPVRAPAVTSMATRAWPHMRSCPPLYMRHSGDRRPSHVVKSELLGHARGDGFNPMLVFEDRREDTAMWRKEGLLCCQVADGNY